MGVLRESRNVKISNVASAPVASGSVSSSNPQFKGFEYKTDEMLVPARIWVPEDTFFATSDGTLEQIRNMAMLPAIYDHVVITPDAHEGYSIPIGGVMALRNAVSPNGVGKDCGCGMLAVKTSIFEKDFHKKSRKVMDELFAAIPVGFGWQNQKQDTSALNIDSIRDLEWARIPFKDSNEPYSDMVGLFLGTLGSGNHFMSLEMDENSQIWIMVHSGSRNLGQQIADHYDKLAIEECAARGIILPDPGLAYLDTRDELGREYLRSMDFGLEFARLNRDHMLDRAVLVLESNFKNFTLDGDIVNKHHNYAVAESHGGTEVMVHRKGAIKVEQGDLGIIPGSMDTGSYIVRGLGNEDSFNSASHGAGRRMSRGEAARSLDWDQVKKNLIKKDVLIYKGGVGNLIDSWPQPPYDKKTQRMMKDAISETAKGYKDIEEVLDWEADIVEPVVKLTPRATLKG